MQKCSCANILLLTQISYNGCSLGADLACNWSSLPLEENSHISVSLKRNALRLHFICSALYTAARARISRDASCFLLGALSPKQGANRAHWDSINFGISAISRLGTPRCPLVTSVAQTLFSLSCLPTHNGSQIVVGQSAVTFVLAWSKQWCRWV